ncbi:MAG: tRNA (adenosine(37)-N6)-threonylcarbamoyltransferase complex ATPase subunit type 1 TsaE [Pyrinomonadaceae bacterium]
MESFLSTSPEETFALGERFGSELRPGDVVLLRGGLGAGKTLLTKGIVRSLGFDVDEVTSPSFALVNLYKTGEHNIYHIDLWRIEDGDAAFAVGLDEILDDPRAIVIIEWAERLGERDLPARVIAVAIEGDGDEPRRITISRTEPNVANAI